MLSGFDRTSGASVPVGRASVMSGRVCLVVCITGRPARRSLVRMESDSAGGQQLVADSVPVTLTSGGDPEPDSGPPGAQRAKLQALLRANIRARREEARQRRQREHNMYNNEEVDDSYLGEEATSRSKMGGLKLTRGMIQASRNCEELRLLAPGV